MSNCRWFFGLVRIEIHNFVVRFTMNIYCRNIKFFVSVKKFNIPAINVPSIIFCQWSFFSIIFCNFLSAINVPSIFLCLFVCTLHVIAQLCVNNISMVICSVLDVKPLKCQLHRKLIIYCEYYEFFVFKLCYYCVILSCSKWYVLIQNYTFLKIIVKILKLG